jgi:hypothetical protein
VVNWQPVAVILSVTLTHPAPDPTFQIIDTVLFVEGPEIDPFETAQLYVRPGSNGVEYTLVFPKQGPVSPETTGVGKGLIPIYTEGLLTVPQLPLVTFRL